MKKNTASFIFSLFFLFSLNGFSQAPKSPKYIKTTQGYLMVLKQGDTLFTELERFALKENVPSASFTGFGFVNIEFGYFNFKTKKYKPKKIDDLELAASEGSIAWQNGKPSIHVHGIGGDKKFKAHAGHILSAIVSTGSLEITITVYDKRLERVKDEELEVNVLELK